MPRRFVVSDAHMEAFSKQQRKRFEDEMVLHLTREFPEEANRVGEDWLREMIREGVQSAEGYNILLERDVARYLELMLAISPDFDDSDKTPWAKDILTDERMTGQEKLDRICEHVMFDHDDEDTGAGDVAATDEEVDW